MPLTKKGFGSDISLYPFGSDVLARLCLLFEPATSRRVDHGDVHRPADRGRTTAAMPCGAKNSIDDPQRFSIAFDRATAWLGMHTPSRSTYVKMRIRDEPKYNRRITGSSRTLLKRPNSDGRREYVRSMVARNAGSTPPGLHKRVVRAVMRAHLSISLAGRCSRTAAHPSR